MHIVFSATNTKTLPGFSFSLIDVSPLQKVFNDAHTHFGSCYLSFGLVGRAHEKPKTCISSMSPKVCLGRMD
jgi:hypothetical protein